MLIEVRVPILIRPYRYCALTGTIPDHVHTKRFMSKLKLLIQTVCPSSVHLMLMTSCFTQLLPLLPINCPLLHFAIHLLGKAGLAACEDVNMIGQLGAERLAAGVIFGANVVVV